MSGWVLTKGGVGSGNSPGLSEATDVKGVKAGADRVLGPVSIGTRNV
jgi:hypothetical protein